MSEQKAAPAESERVHFRIPARWASMTDAERRALVPGGSADMQRALLPKEGPRPHPDQQEND